ncbi:MAG TPA: lipopolysaccharide kinase InaA family protein [Patescibacteria group bacterium]|nr:lipopolysaccharide kinase InaA family protein [Patescibacteria group bacterium]
MKAYDKAPRAEAANDKADLLSLAEKRQAVSLVSDEIYHGHGRKGMELIETGALGATDSAHDVFFARSESRRDLPMPEAVAIKRFRRHESAAKELANLREVQNRGLRTVEPVYEGIYQIGDMGDVLITAHIPRFTTMNQVGWHDHQAGQEGYQELASMLRAIGAFTGRMQGAGVIHNDWQLKNVGQVADGEFVVFDVEGARFFDPNSEDELETVEFSGNCLEDMSKLIGSLINNRFLATASPELFEQEIADNLIAPYLENGGHIGVLENYDELMANAATLRRQSPGMNPADLGRLILA